MKKTIAIMLALILCAGALQAQESRKGQWTVGVAGGYEQHGSYNDASKLQALLESYQFGVFGEYMFNTHWGIKAELNSSMQYKAHFGEVSFNQKVPGIQIFVGAKYEWQFEKLFLGLSMGPGYSYRNLEHETYSIFICAEPEIGLWLNNHWSIRLSNRWNFDMFDSNYSVFKGNDGTTFSGGFNATLGVAYTF